MAIIGQYEFGEAAPGLGNGEPDETTAAAPVLSNAVLGNGLQLTGQDSYAEAALAAGAALESGTLNISFCPTGQNGSDVGTVISRGISGDQASDGFSVATVGAGRIAVFHNTGGGNHTFSTPAGFFAHGDDLSVSYSWDASGKGGAFIATNSATGATYSEAISAALTMNFGDDDSDNWILGASRSEDAEAGEKPMADFFDGTISGVSLSNTVDNAALDGLVEGTDGADLIDADYLGDPDGDRVDHGDAIAPGARPNDDVILAGAGDDTINAGRGRDEIHGGDGDDLIFGSYGNDTVYGDAGDDTVVGGWGRDVIYGGEGNDFLDGGGDNDDDEDYIDGGAGDDTLTGSAGADTLLGGDDRDVFIGTTVGDYIDGGEGGIDFDTLDLSDWGAAATNIIYDPNNPENGIVEFLDQFGNIVGTLTFENIENVVPCFTPGTVVATPKGERPVEDLVPGDKVVTRDNGIQEIRWVGSKALNYGQLAAAAHLKPILITRGSLGKDLPERDMLVSPNHRMLVANERTALYFEEHEVLVSAKHLVNSTTIREVQTLGTTYVHFMCDRHEVVLANGCWTESFQPGDYSLNGLGNAQRGEIYELFPELKSGEGRQAYKAARKTLKRHEAKLLRFR
ncbi:MAG: Hint domain-containing protein [Paracoccaceae bacterium]